MIRTLTFVMFLVATNVATASLTSPRAGSFDLIRSDLHSEDKSDTTLLALSAAPALSFQDLVFKRRLDSLQNSVPLNYNEYVQRYIDIYVSRKEQIGKMLGLSKYYFPIFEKALREAGLPDEIKFLTVIESALNPHAVSKSGAVGPWQFMYTTAKGYGLVMDTYVDERKDPVKASYAAAHYLVDAYKRIGDWLLTIAAFNCGTGAVTRAIQKSGGVADFWKVRSFLPQETQNYVPAFIATVYAMNYYKTHSIEPRPAGFNISTDVIQVNRKISIASVAAATGLDIKELSVLNPSYKKQVINGSLQYPKSLVIPGIENSAYASLYEVLNGEESPQPEAVHASVKNPSAEPISAPDYQRVRPGQIPGQNIRLSAPQKPSSTTGESGYMSYIVKVGDTLSGIADKFTGLTVSKLKALNGLTRSAISPGMRLIVNSL